MAKHDLIVPSADLNQYIVCTLCQGYISNATTISDCLHTFCRRCILAYVKEHEKCPRCSNKSILKNLCSDPNYQEIVSVLSSSQVNESTSKELFYNNYGLPVPADELPEKYKTLRINTEEKVTVHLKCISGPSGARPLTHPIVTTRANTTIKQLKKVIAKNFYANENQYDQIEMFFDKRLLTDDMTLIAIYVHYFKYKVGIMPLNFKVGPAMRRRSLKKAVCRLDDQKNLH